MHLNPSDQPANVNPITLARVLVGLRQAARAVTRAELLYYFLPGTGKTDAEHVQRALDHLAAGGLVACRLQHVRHSAKPATPHYRLAEGGGA